MAAQAPPLPDPVRHAIDRLVLPTDVPDDPVEEIPEQVAGFNLRIERETKSRVTFTVGGKDEEMQLREMFGHTGNASEEETVLAFQVEKETEDEIVLYLRRPQLLAQVL